MSKNLDKRQLERLERTQWRRKGRYHRRECAKAFANNEDKICTICQETIENNFETEITACGHTFHSKCGISHRISQFHESMAWLRSNPCPSSLIVKHINQYMVEYETGKSCPNCRQIAPFAYRLAKKATFEEMTWSFPQSDGTKMVSTATAENALKLASSN